MSVNFDPEDLESRERYSFRSVVPGADTAQAVTNPDGSLIGSAPPAGSATAANQALEISALNEIATDTDHLASMDTSLTDIDNVIGTLAVENGGNLQSIQTNTANTEFYVQAHLPSIDTNTTTIATDSGNIATSTAASATSLSEIATDTDNLATILSNQTNGTQKALNIAALVPVAFDTIQVTAVDGSDRPTTVLYKTGGLGGATVATLTIVYDGSGNFQSVVRT